MAETFRAAVSRISAWWSIPPTFRESRKCRRPSIMSSARLWRCYAVPSYELFGTSSCPYTQDMREWLEWKGYEYKEYDVEADRAARARMIAIPGGQRMAPIL